ERGGSMAVMRWMTPPWPAGSRPSKVATTLRPRWRTQSSSWTSLTCSSRSCFSYSFLVRAVALRGFSAVHSPSFFFLFLSFLAATAIAGLKLSPAERGVWHVSEVGREPVRTGQLGGAERARDRQAAHARGAGRGHPADRVLDHQAGVRREPQSARRLPEDIRRRLFELDRVAVHHRSEQGFRQADLVQVRHDLDAVGAGGDRDRQSPPPALVDQLDRARQRP